MSTGDNTKQATATLFDEQTLGPYKLKNRVYMAPLTRGRAGADGTPTAVMAEYYRQRSSAGLIISEATSISKQGAGFTGAPGIHTDSHREGWKAVTNVVHDAGGRIFLQLWHLGRVSHPDFLDGQLPIAPSAVAAEGHTRTHRGKQAYVVPRALRGDELPGLIEDYARAAAMAVEAGFDGVELHGANGYLLDQFMRDGSNRREDEYGGSMENRWRFPLEVARAVAERIGADKTGMRLSPTGPYNSMSDSDPVATFTHGARELGKIGIVYLHVIEGLPGSTMHAQGAPAVARHMREVFDGVFILNGGYDAQTGNEALAENRADAIAYGVPFLANPDLPRRLREGAELNKPDPKTFYSSGEKGYTDYPALDGAGE